MNKYSGFPNIKCDPKYLATVKRTDRLKVSGQKLEAVSACTITIKFSNLKHEHTTMNHHGKKHIEYTKYHC